MHKAQARMSSRCRSLWYLATTKLVFARFGHLENW